MARLDDTDVKLLNALQRDAKTGTKELCELLNLSKTPVYERIHRLEKEGVITGYRATVDHNKVGLPLVVFCNVSLAEHNDEHFKQFIEDINLIDEVMECYSTGGIYDILIKVVLKDIEEYNRFVHERLTKVRGIVKIQSSFVLSEIKKTSQLNLSPTDR
ncbi:Lrp/AsnC family transcriptional regulator [Duncaniella sp.]|uniref:Lrp/AsnC family transcriptional regulator n=1 Tax=Duncaniella sp. TaxID=2518496 RepID=UPI0023CA9C02|nr:Lrp/AsnC family transcriptional regulator [Duncaniella sp.]MDE5689101.1 Lrp/AsnC family transcriptional regulator [Duncaniella sp.]MDE5905955.1 Lrp/AsnC family transcriptional regulator [Duncaniella sp.]